ncbi:MAG: 3'-5' exonuclease [Halioglobus sp.]
MWPLLLRRLRHRSSVSGTVLGDCWELPLPKKRDDWRSVSFLVCDAEMSSLEVTEGELLSLGWVSIENGAIALGSASHYLINAEASVGQSATIHQLRDCELRDGLTELQVLEHFLAAAAGRVLVFHNAALDMAYLNRSSERCFYAPLLLPAVDTLALEHARFRKQGRVIKPGDLRLHECRNRYHLPSYPAHNALVDALATAELLIAQAKHRGSGAPLRLADFF